MHARFTLLVVALAGSAATPTPAPPPSPGDLPAALACLQRWYAGQPEKRDGAWVLALPDGAVIPWNDGKSKTFEEKLALPDVEDAFSIPYRSGAIQPVTDVDRDPGRIRLDPMFRATYGTAQQVSIERVTIRGQSLPVHARAVEAFRRVAKRLDEAVAKDKTLDPYLRNLGGTFLQRNIAGTDRPSAHSWGVSIDINVKRSNYWQWQKGPIRWTNKIPQAIVDAFEAEGFVWGGRWYHYDTMHFEWRPELLDPACLTAPH